MPDVAVVGQVARDLVLVVDALPEPGGAVRVRERHELLGGKGANQAVGIAQLGLRVAVVGVVGDDDAGQMALKQARRDVDTSAAVVRPGAATALLTDLVENGGVRRLFEDVPADVLLSAADVEGGREVLTGAHTVSVQLQQPAEAVLAALRIARQAGRRTIVDGAVEDAGARADVVALADVVRADATEAALLAGHPLESVEETVDAAKHLLGTQNSGPSVVALAAGKHGNVVAWRGGHVVVPLLDISPTVDPTGGGDAFVAGLLVSLARDRNAEEAAWRASAAAALVAARPGGRPDLSEELLDRHLDRYRHRHSAGERSDSSAHRDGSPP